MRGERRGERGLRKGNADAKGVSEREKQKRKGGCGVGAVEVVVG